MRGLKRNEPSTRFRSARAAARSARAHDHQYVETAACFGEGFEGVPGDATARAVTRPSQVRLPSFQIDRDILGRRACVHTLLDGHQDVGRSKPVQRRRRTSGDATTCPPLVAERIGGDRQDLAGLQQLGQSGCDAPGTSPRAEPRCSHDVRRLCVSPRFATRAQAQLSQWRHTRWRAPRQPIPKQSSEAPLFSCVRLRVSSRSRT